jgi:hypothetical protein
VQLTTDTGCEVFLHLLSVHQAECTTRCKSKPAYNFAEYLLSCRHDDRTVQSLATWATTCVLRGATLKCALPFPLCMKIASG